MDINSIECFESFEDELLQCEKCKSMFHLDDGFVDIAEICDGTEQDINDYEKKHNVDLLNFWCQDCANKTLKEIEGI